MFVIIEMYLKVQGFVLLLLNAIFLRNCERRKSFAPGEWFGFLFCKCKLTLMVSFMVNKRRTLVLLLPENTRVEVVICMGIVTGPLLVLQREPDP